MDYDTSTLNDVTITNKVTTKVARITLKKWKEWIDNGQLITLPDFLQRLLIEDDWWANDYEQAKNYLVSLIKGTADMDAFSIVTIDLIIEKLRDEVDAGADSYKTALDELIVRKQQGAIYLSLDGQSRTFLALRPYFDNSINGLGDAAKTITLKIAGKAVSILENRKWNALPLCVRQYIESLPITVNEIVDFYQFKDIIEALVNKQKGWSWTRFQIWKQENRFNGFVVDLVKFFSTEMKDGRPKETEGSKFTKFWKDKMISKIDIPYKATRDGHQYFAVIMYSLLSAGIWDKNVSHLLSGSVRPTKSIFKKIFDYSNELFSIRVDKSSISDIINWIVFRWVVDGGNKQNHIYTAFGFTKKYIVKDSTKLVEAFLKHQIKLKGSKKKEDAFSWEKRSDGTIGRRDGGFFHYCLGQTTDKIKSRMTTFINTFDFDKAVADGILVETDRQRPSKQEVLIYRGGLDVEDNDVEVLNLSSYDVSHYVSSANNGPDILSNLGLEKRGPNRSRGSKNI